ncbi:MAG TPA: NAD(P)-dependent oxidoreductase [Candidatus Polarisedimenticolaceae bacterium]|nr:NAD(P)-dependent oxidoreductase [Candidatus Polarisedimenticolaceae bacterium]
MKIAVLGANGQVGSEVCLLLARVPGVEVVPVCRNPSGSAFLRWHGLDCRHGLITDRRQARRLLEGCSVVANFALAVGRPRESRTLNRSLVEHAAEESAAGAKVVYFSTLSVHASFQPAGSPRGRSAYGREKLRCERDARRAGRRSGKATWILRLGHVCGELQEIHEELRRLVTGGTVVVPRGGEGRANVTHTVTIVDALLRIAAGAERPGTYDLVSVPPLSWREVLGLQASAAGVPLRLQDGGTPAPGGIAAAVRGWLGRQLTAPRTREVGLSLIAHLPESLNLKVQAQHFRRRAAAEIAALGARPPSHPAFTFPDMDVRPLAALTPTKRLLEEGRGGIPLPRVRTLPAP